MFLKGTLKLTEKSQEVISNGFLIRNLQTANCSFKSGLFLKLLRQRALWSFFLQKQVVTVSLQNNCSKQQLKLSRTLASVLETFFATEFLLWKKFRMTKFKTSKDKIKFLQCQCWDFQMVQRKYSKLVQKLVKIQMQKIVIVFKHYS